MVSVCVTRPLVDLVAHVARLLTSCHPHEFRSTWPAESPPKIVALNRTGETTTRSRLVMLGSEESGRPIMCRGGCNLVIFFK